MKLYHVVFIFIFFFSCTDGQEDPITVRSTTSDATETNLEPSGNTSTDTSTTQTITPTADTTQTITSTADTTQTITPTADTTQSTTTSETSQTSTTDTSQTTNSGSTSTGNISSDEIDYSIYEVQFVNENLGFATAGDKLLKTEDGGVSWTEVFNSSGISEVLFLDELVGFINTDRGYNEQKLFKTTDGGNSFQEISDLSRSITDIYESNGTLIISSSSYYSKADEYEDDDGESYVGIVCNSIFNISNDEGETFDSYDFYDSNNANNTFDGIIDSHGHFSIIVKDNILFMDMGSYGKNWVVRFDLDTNDLEDFVYNENRQLFLDSGMIVQTPNIRIKTYSIVGDKIYAFGHFFTPLGDYTEDNGFIYSNDNGESWTFQSFGKYEEITFFSSYFSSLNNGYIVGESGHFLKTIDGGDNWTKIDLGTYKNIHDIERINDTTLILVGEDGFIYKYDTTN
tara:strand:- start:1870 stop:3237 length:1368 start_codon:yes stop_codon:yes gene_type:complete